MGFLFSGTHLIHSHVLHFVTAGVGLSKNKILNTDGE